MMMEMYQFDPIEGPSWSQFYKNFFSFFVAGKLLSAGNTKEGSITVQLASCLDKSVLKIKTKIINCHTADSKPVEQEVNSTVILPPLLFPAFWMVLDFSGKARRLPREAALYQ